MFGWLRQRFWPCRAGEGPIEQRLRSLLAPTTVAQTGMRMQKVARLIRVLSFYADPNNYVRENVLQHESPVARDGGKRAREALALVREVAPVGQAISLDRWRNR